MLKKRFLLMIVVLLTFSLMLAACGDPEIHNERTHGEVHSEEEGAVEGEEHSEEGEEEAVEGEESSDEEAVEGETEESQESSSTEETEATPEGE